ncbi:MAG: flagellar protein FlaG [Steroidobacteraceae bacterium]
MASEIGGIRPIGTPGSMPDLGSGRRNKQGSAEKRPDPAPVEVETSAEASSVAEPSSPQTLQSAVKQINAHLAQVNRTLELRTDAGTGLTVAVIKNAWTGEIVQQIPTEDSIQLAQMLSAWADGGNVLLDLIA